MGTAVVLLGLGGWGVVAVGLPGVSVSLAVVAAGTALWGRTAWTVALTGSAAVVSLLVTALLPRPGESRTSGFGLTEAATAVELLALLALIVVVTRRAQPVRDAVVAGGLAGMAVAALVLRLLSPASVLDLVSACALWSLAAAGAATVGAYLRVLDDRRARSVVEARRAQRLDLARDLHDYVAHDVSEMVAQAAGVVAAADPEHARRALQHIEQSGLRALAAMDQTVHMLRPDPADAAAAQVTPPGLAALPEVAARFSAAGSAQVTLELDVGLEERLPREVAATAHRIVVEALTNVRRHAPTATRVEVTIHAVDRAGGIPALEVVVTNDGAAPDPGVRRVRARRGGLGLAGLRERVEVLGGALTAGPSGASGWQVTASLPLTVQPGGGG